MNLAVYMDTILVVPFAYLIVQMHQIIYLHVKVLETVLLKAAALMSRKTNDETAAISMLCRVSHVWWIVIQNCGRQKRVAFQHYVDSKSVS